MNEIELNKLIENYNNILYGDNSSQDDDKGEYIKISGNKSNISSDEENNNTIIENQININENIIEEIEDDDINDSYDILENKDEQQLIDNIINLIEDCNIDNNIDSQGNKKDDNKNNTIIKEYNRNGLENNKNIHESTNECSMDKEKKDNINEDYEENWFKKSLKERVTLKTKKIGKKKNFKTYNYPKDE